MKQPAFLFGTILLLLTLLVDVFLILMGTTTLGILCLIGTILVFAGSTIWLIRQDDQALHLKHLFLVVPIACFGLGITKMFSKVNADLQMNQENIQEVGNLIMSRYQVGLWLVSVIVLLAFVIAGSLMTRGRT